MKLTQAIAIKVKNLLMERSLTQYQLFKLGGVPRSTLNDIINNKKKRVSTDSIYQICATLGVSLKQFFDDDLFENLDD